MRIIGFDYPCMDMNILCPHMPTEEELVEFQDVSLMGGGKIANAVAAVARLGAETAFIGAVGNDRYGKLCVEDLKMLGVDVSHLEMRKGRTAFCVSIVDSEKRGKHYIESASTVQPWNAADIPYEIFKKGDYLMLYQMDTVAEKMAEYVHENGGTVVVDGDEFDERTQRNLRNIDVFILSEYYYNHLYSDGEYKKNLGLLSKEGPPVVVVTLGAKGCAGMDHGRFFESASYPVEVLDTTGAGDVFHGAFTCGIAEGMNAESAALFAGAVSAIKCTVLGGRTGIPTRKCVEHFQNTGEILPCDFAEREEQYREAFWR